MGRATHLRQQKDLEFAGTTYWLLRHNPRVRLRGSLLCAVVALLAPVAANATAPSAEGRLARALAAPQLVPAESAAIAVDLATGQTLFSRNADVALEPASNEKLAVTYG